MYLKASITLSEGATEKMPRPEACIKEPMLIIKISEKTLPLLAPPTELEEYPCINENLSRTGSTQRLLLFYRRILDLQSSLNFSFALASAA
jgi:hypothetical protein